MLQIVTRRSLIAALVLIPSLPAAFAEEAEGEAPAKVSYYRQVRPILQAHCQGCHQPAKPGGEFVMTAFDRLLAGGESGMAAIVPGKPDESNLVEAITPVDGEAYMPKEKKPLHATEIELIRRWIAEGAADDTPESAKQRYDMDHPPVYTRPPVITSIDYSPDGKLLAAAGFHEALLVNAETGELAGRLVGMSQRLESVKFSPDGAKLAVTGGLPGRMGEVQVWDVAKRELVLSVPVTYDTVYGGSWSPDGKLIAFGCADNTVRAIDAATGEQVLFQGAHEDWIRDTVFSADGSHLVSVARDMTSKLTEVATQRFIDNITSITPGALKGGVQAVARHPERDEIVIGGADGVAKVYRIHRLTKRVIGDDGNLIREMPPMKGRIFGVDVSRDGRRIVAGSALDHVGEVQIYSYEFDTSLPDNIKAINEKVVTTRSAEEKEALEKYHKEGVKLIAQASLPQAGVYTVAFHPEGKLVAAAGSDGVIRLIDAESGSIAKEFSPAPVVEQAAGQTASSEVASADFIRDVNPILSRLGCNAGTCHGSLNGKNGFKLSLRGYDPIFDVRALTDDLASRRVNVASPDDSLMLLKSTAAVPHEGGQVLKPDGPYYQTIRAWIAAGAKLDLSTPRVTQIEVSPVNPVLENSGGKLQMKVVATYADGQTRDVTHEAFIESGNTEVAVADRYGMMTGVRRGEAPVLARYEGAYAATTLTVMGDRTGFVWEDPPTWGRIDELVAQKWQRMKIKPSELCTDEEFIRRVYLDLIGLPPTADQVRAFVADKRETRVKRDELVDRLVGNDEYVEYWTNKWADLLQVNRKFLGAEGAAQFRAWIRREVADNTPYDRFAHKILTADGSNRENPAASYYKVLRQPVDIMENTTHLFLAVRFNCNKCHDHPFERWTQDQYYETAAYFARVGLKADPASGDKRIGGTAVEGAKPLYEIVYEKPEGEITHDRTGTVTEPEFPFECDFRVSDEASRREKLAAWITSPDNPYFTRSYVNRLWGYLFGVGVIEPIDDIRAGNPPSNPELLDYLTEEFINSGFNVRHVMRLICKSRTYQLSVATNEWNADDRINYSHATARRLPAEVLLDSIYAVTGAELKFPGVPAGTRAAELPDAGVELPSGFLSKFGRPARESACECERSSELQLGPVMALISGPTVSEAIADPNNAIAKLAGEMPDDQKLINELFMRVLNRPATENEVEASLRAMQAIDDDHRTLVQELEKAEAEFAPTYERLTKEREERIARAKAEVEAYEKEIAPRIAEQEKQKAARTAQLEAQLKRLEAALPGRLAIWEKQYASASGWTPLDPSELKSTNGAKLEKQPDGSIFVSGNGGKTTYTFAAKIDQPGVTGVRLEALADDRLPSKGPGRAPNGNFVLIELDLSAAPASKPDEQYKIRLRNAQSTFNQGNYPAAAAIDGKKDAVNNGWAIAGGTGKDQTAVFEVAEELPFDGGTILTFSLDHEFADGQHALGRFRISFTTDPAPLRFQVPEEVQTVLALAPQARSAEQSGKLLEYFRNSSFDWQQRNRQVEESRKPLPIDPKLKELQDKLAEAERPVPIEPRVARLRHDVEMSDKQLANKRLTMAQDLAWALINSPAFLFNR